MIIVYRPDGSGHGRTSVSRHALEPAEPIPADALWIDMLEPTREEDRKVEGFIGASIPTREEMKDIEPSELLYTEGGNRYMTARLLCRAETDEPCLTGVTFILRNAQLVTVRYDEPRAFQMYAQRAGKPDGCGRSGESVLGGLIDTIIDRAADVLQMVGERIDVVSRNVFEERRDPNQRNAELQGTLRALGRYGDLISKQRESLVSIERLVLFLSVGYRTVRVAPELREQVRSAMRDLQSLEEHATFQASKIQFLLDATLGLVNLEQNNIIKLFSVVAVVFMPPTLIASIYGMNFKNMPELEWPYGYPTAIGLMILAAILPYLFFHWKRWL